jgi:D-methionine transport system ATP-binding protein
MSTIIELKNVEKTFKVKGRTIQALKNINLQIGEGEIFGIIGYSGAGKSTLVRLINGLEKPTSGEVIVQGENVSELRGAPLRKFRQKIGMIFQGFNLLWSRTAKENIELPLELVKGDKATRETRAIELLDLVGLKDRADNYPNALSGGEKQRVGVARALSNNPCILLSDEATSALDPKTTREILALIKDIRDRLKVTVVIITHEMSVVREVCDKVAVMQAGEIVETGTVADVFNNPQADITKHFLGGGSDE